MMSLQQDELKEMMDASSSRLVWVRRRNGSWWPGRMLNVDELKKCLCIKKAGTPIKLLGRDEGTVDWYNLENSKCIKAFRCGEYDACIARAKASSIRSNRGTANSRKYVRREDAIIHALELEKYYLTNGNEMPSFSKNNSKFNCISKDLVKQRKVMFKELVSTERKPGKPEKISNQKLSHSVVSFGQPEQPLKSTLQFIQKKRLKSQLDSEDDTNEGITRMKYLQDLGYGVMSTGSSDMRVSMKDPHARDPCGFPTRSEPDFDNNLSSVDPRSRFKHSCSSLRSTLMFHAYQNLRRRKRRRRRLTKICLGSDKVNVPLVYQNSVVTGDLPSYKITTMTRLNELKSSSKKTKILLADKGSLGTSPHLQGKSGTAVYGFNPPTVVRNNADDDLSNSLVNVPILFDERNVEGVLHMPKRCTSKKIHSIAAEKLSIHSLQVCLVSKSTEGLVEAGPTNFANHDVQKIKKSYINHNSNIKGHSRYSSLYSNQNSECLDDEVDNACSKSLTTDINDQSVRCDSLNELSNMLQARTLPASINNDPTKGFVCTYKSLQSGKNLHSSYSTYRSQLNVTREIYRSTMQVKDSDKNQQSVLSVSPQCAVLDLFNSSSMASLYDVEMKVQANYHGQRAPLVSFVSKLNGKSIVGHAITVDVLGDGSSTALLNSVCHLNGCSINLFKNRVDVICNLHEKLDHLETSRPSIQEKSSHLSYTNFPLLKSKPLRRRKYGFSPRKIRRLSSITVGFNGREKGREIIVEKMELSSVFCVPIKVVFSRLNEALGCTSHLMAEKKACSGTFQLGSFAYSGASS